MDNAPFDKYGIKQIGYYVKSIDESAEQFKQLFDAGPFVDMGVNKLKSCKVRGLEQPVQMRTALGQLGSMQLELIEVQSDCPDPYKEMGHYGIHHFCIWADDPGALVQEFEKLGCSVAMEIESGQGLKVYYLDAREQLGQYVEINAPLDQLAGAIAAVHAKWSNEKSLISMQALMDMMGR